MKRPLAYFGHRILRQKAKEVPCITPAIKQLVQDMIDTMHAHYGVGLAAVQVHEPYRIIIICPDAAYLDDGQIEGQPRVFINPKLSDPSPETETRQEGCLSLPGVDGSVQRPISVTIEAQDLQGQIIKERLHGYAARIAMHENDHINGVLFIDRLPEKERKRMEKQLRQIKKQYGSK